MCCDGGLVADHERVWARHQTITDPAHLRRRQAAAPSRLTVQPPAETQVEQRCLTDYDAASLRATLTARSRDGRPDCRPRGT